MLLGRVVQHLLSYSSHSLPATESNDALQFPTVSFLTSWQVLGPFQIGTREAIWGADPLEQHGGFRALEYNNATTFRSSLAANGTIRWSNLTAKVPVPDIFHTTAELNVSFPDIDWKALRDVYGWAAYQWQAWARGQIVVQGDETEYVALYTPQILEFWVDDVHYFGGDFYDYKRVPITIRLAPGIHLLDVRLVRDIRSMGGVSHPDMQINLDLRKISPGLKAITQTETSTVLLSDFIGEGASLASPYASVVLRNDGHQDVEMTGIHINPNIGRVELLSSRIRLVPGQTRPVAFRIKCIPPSGQYPSQKRINIDFQYRVQGHDEDTTLVVSAEPRIVPAGKAHKVTFMHPGGVVSYAILRPPSRKAIQPARTNQTFPILLNLHGAGVDVDSDVVREVMDPLPDLQAWVLFPTGGTNWSGDDWHSWGFADVEAAVAMIEDRIERFDWKGPGVDENKWLVAGHSNGGQGTWYALTHRPDKIFAAAPISGYSSIQNYVPYTFSHVADPGRTAIKEAALLSYKHELLLSNAKGIPVLQQHGGADDNVPAYHSRLMSQLIQEAGADSQYFEVPGEGHYWDGVYTTEALTDFYERQISLEVASVKGTPLNLRDFSLVVANPGDTGSKHGVEVLQLATPGQLARIDVAFDPLTLACIVRTTNLRMFRLPPYFRDCSFVQVDNQKMPISFEQSDASSTLTKQSEKWETTPLKTHPPTRLGHQLGPLDSILHTNGPFHIIPHTPQASPLALQISRNLHQYFSADTSLTTTYATALHNTTGNIISLATGASLPPCPIYKDFPIQIRAGGDAVFIRGPNNIPTLIPNIAGLGLAAVFLRPLPDERLELVVWGADLESLALAARFVPTMTGTGVPDFVVLNREVLWKGLEGVLAMGFFDSQWDVSGKAFIA
ncbi:hypothetical protein M409DRAFT_24592 [Zasmidium cellare ATCC 36951]|uniref:Peptidase S9 prolyl oligopeptidase catalytic domain-containing protein n=1 Tax=Zasmidium cellare ATCC 36951 TaxID=1080233 RepID=A0A6A6CHP4_ZASCE|nr:uncharacterized protein M409DRAFT_24592 [Zasmidium cellare ATCC 36951]KAF2165209.1 hypothetical protein M409DRAFT_24592 [Zasmidium cellare ATCC 36951]